MESAASTVAVAVDHRQRLLDGLAASIREKGLVATQVSDIVRHARASRRTFYNAFADKDACFLALAEQLSADGFAVVAASVDEALDWEAQVDVAIDAWLGVLAREPAMTITFAVELATLGAAGQALRRRGVERYAEFVMGLTRTDAMRRAGVRQISRHTAILLIGGINEVVSLAVAHGEPLEDVALSIKATLRAVLAPRPAVAASERRA